MKPFHFIVLIVLSFTYLLYYVLFNELEFSYTDMTNALIAFYLCVLLFIVSVVLLFASLGEKPPKKTQTKTNSPSNTGETVIQLINHMKD